MVFLGLAVAGQIALVVFSRLILVPVARRLKRRYWFGTPTFTDIIVTVPLFLQIRARWRGLRPPAALQELKFS